VGIITVNKIKSTRKDSSLEAETLRLYQAIGCIVVSFQQIEQWLAQVLAMLLRMRERDDQHLVSAAMSFGQKVDLLVELYPKRRPQYLKEVNMVTIRQALVAAEEFRNRVVHSFWAIECGDEARWIRIKGSLRGRKGFNVKTTSAQVEMLETCDQALHVIREWMRRESAELDLATSTLKAYLNQNT